MLIGSPIPALINNRIQPPNVESILKQPQNGLRGTNQNCLSWGGDIAGLGCALACRNFETNLQNIPKLTRLVGPVGKYRSTVSTVDLIK